MTALTDSVAITSVTKRMPKKKQFRRLMILRDRLIDELTTAVKDNKTHIPNKKVVIVQEMNIRILRRLKKEDLHLQKQTQTQMELYTHNRTIVEFRQYGEIIRSTFTGTIEQAKDNLRRGRGVKGILWAHFYRSDKDLTTGMWSDMEVISNREKTFQ